MLTLYPAIKPYARHRLEVAPPHELYLEESGNPDGIPVLYLHGGPGAACDRHSRRYFDPELYRIILLDQRGCGRSTPFAELEGNNTPALLQDLEAIRSFLGIESWVLFGGSWGATLALLYAQAHPAHTRGLVLRGVNLYRDEDIRWLYGEGARRIFPDYWEQFVQPIPEAERADLLGAYYRRLTGADELACMAAARNWAQWQGRCATLRPNQDLLDRYAEPHKAVAQARIECHYLRQRAFLDEGQLLQGMTAVAEIPAILVHGRYDMISPLESAYALQQRWPAAELHIVRDAGHSAVEAGVVDALVRATGELANKLRDGA